MYAFNAKLSFLTATVFSAFSLKESFAVVAAILKVHMVSDRTKPFVSAE